MMPRTSAYFQLTLQAMVFIAIAFGTYPLRAQGLRVMFLQGERLTFEARDNSSFRLSMTTRGKIAMEVKLDGRWRDLASEDGVKALKKSVGYKAVYYVEDLVKRNGFTPQQAKKLMLAATVQVARDCRKIHQLRSAYFDIEHDDPFKIRGEFDDVAVVNVASDCTEMLNEIDGIMVGGVDRKNSLFRKVLNNLK